MLHNGKDVVIHVSRKGCEDGDEAGDRARDAIARLTGLDEEGVEDLVRFILILGPESVRAIRYASRGLVIGFETGEGKEVEE